MVWVRRTGRTGKQDFCRQIRAIGIFVALEEPAVDGIAAAAERGDAIAGSGIGFRILVNVETAGWQAAGASRPVPN
jgi:hypothetical protein